MHHSIARIQPVCMYPRDLYAQVHSALHWVSSRPPKAGLTGVAQSFRSSRSRKECSLPRAKDRCGRRCRARSRRRSGYHRVSNLQARTCISGSCICLLSQGNRVRKSTTTTRHWGTHRHPHCIDNGKVIGYIWYRLVYKRMRNAALFMFTWPAKLPDQARCENSHSALLLLDPSMVMYASGPSWDNRNPYRLCLVDDGPTESFKRHS